MFFGVSSSVTECFQSVTDYLQPVTELGTPKNMAVALPGMTLQPLYRYLPGVNISIASMADSMRSTYVLSDVSGEKKGVAVHGVSQVAGTKVDLYVTF